MRTIQFVRRSNTVLCMVFACLCIQLQAQNPTIDRLNNWLKNAKDDISKVDTLNFLAKQYWNTQPDSAIAFGEKSQVLAAKIGYQRGMGYALKAIGIGNYNKGNYANSVNAYTQAKDIFIEIKDSVGIANMYSNLGAVYFSQGEDAKALEFYFAGRKIAENQSQRDTLRIATILMNIGAVYYEKKKTRPQALEYYQLALPLIKSLGDSTGIGTVMGEIGEIYLEQSKDSLALASLDPALKWIGTASSDKRAYILNLIGKVYAARHDFTTALRYQFQSLKVAEEADSKNETLNTLIGLAETYDIKSDVAQALSTFLKAEVIAREVGNNYRLEDIYHGLSLDYSKLGDFKQAFKYQSMLLDVKSTIYSIEADKKTGTFEFTYNIGQQKSQLALQDRDIQKQKLAQNALIGGLVLVFIIAFIIFRGYRQKVKTNAILDKQKDQIETLLLNILPAEVAHQLQHEGYSEPKHYDSVTVLFTDFKGFTTIASGLTPDELVKELNGFFSAFDDIMGKHNVEKIKTIGDAYMCAGGLPTANTTHPMDVVNAGLEIQEYMRAINEERTAKGMQNWNLRVGIHTGPVVAGVVGKKKYAYDIWGSTVNIASRLESNGEAGRVNLSAETHELIKEKHECEYRGKIYAKNVGEIDMYFVNIDVSQLV